MTSQEMKTSSQLEFFSMRDNTWNKIEVPHVTCFNAAYLKEGSFFNGAIHWLAYRDIEVEVVFVFDLMERKLLEIPLPDDFDHDPAYHGLWVFGEFLSLWNRNFHNWAVEIWVMKEYKQRSSWTKSLVIPSNIMCFSPIYSTKDGDIVGTDDDKGQLLEYLEMNPNASEVTMYTASPV